MKKIWRSGGSLVWRGDSVTWKAWLWEPLRLPTEGQAEKTGEKPVCAFSVGQAKPGLLILVRRNTCLLLLSSHVSESLRNPQTKPQGGEQRREARQGEEPHWLVGSDFSWQDGKSTNQIQRGKPNGIYCYNPLLLPAFGEYFGGAGKPLGPQKPQLLNVSRPLHVWGKEVWDLPRRKISKLLHCVPISRNVHFPISNSLCRLSWCVLWTNPSVGSRGKNNCSSTFSFPGWG